MIYLSLADKIEKNNIKKIINELEIKDKIFDTLASDEDSIEQLKKSKIVICDLDIENIKDYLAMKKIVIVFKGKRANLNTEENDILYDKRVYTYKYKNELREILSYFYKKNKIKKISITVILLILALVSCLIVSSTILISNHTVSNNETKKTEQKKETNKNKENKKIDYKKENIVLLGDSITDFYNVDKFYEGLPVVNSGISGNGVDNIYDNLKERVYRYNPTKVFLMIGTNDISYRSDEYIKNKITEIIKLINKNRPEAKVFLESLYPVNRNTDNDVVVDWMVGERDNERIMGLNQKIKTICKDKEAKCEYIDMYDELTDENGDLTLEYTVDGLHMTEAGYKIVTKKLMEYIDPATKEETVEKK